MPCGLQCAHGWLSLLLLASALLPTVTALFCLPFGVTLPPLNLQEHLWLARPAVAACVPTQPAEILVHHLARFTFIILLGR